MVDKLPILVCITWRTGSRCGVLHYYGLLLGYGNIATVQYSVIPIFKEKSAHGKLFPTKLLELSILIRYFRIPHLHTISSADLTGDALFKPPSLFAFKPLSWSGLTLAVPRTRYDGWRESGRFVDLISASDNNFPWFISKTGKHCCFGLPRGRVWGDCPEEIFSSSKIFNFWWYHEDRNSRMV